MFFYFIMSNSPFGKILYVLLDGVGDLPNQELNGLTPLEAAYTPPFGFDD